jgi:hypothetical protein
MLQPILMV